MLAPLQHKWHLLLSLDSSLFFLNPEAKNSPNTLVYVQIPVFEAVPPGAQENPQPLFILAKAEAEEAS